MTASDVNWFRLRDSAQFLPPNISLEQTPREARKWGGVAL
jgi:hypothetical protein